MEFAPAEVMQGKLFFTAQLASLATVTVSIGGVSQSAEWSDTQPATPGFIMAVFHSTDDWARL